MSVNDTLDGLKTDTLTVQRRPAGTMVNGRYVPSTSPTTFTIDAVVQPAFNLNRVVGGANLAALVDGQHVTEVVQFHTATEIRTRTPNNDADVIVGYRGANWTVARVERWVLEDEGDDQVHYHVVMTRQTLGAS